MNSFMGFLLVVMPMNDVQEYLFYLILIFKKSSGQSLGDFLFYASSEENQMLAV